MTELVLVVDKSGSMGGLVEMATKAINKVVKDQAKVGGDCNLTVVMFADSPKIICDSKPISRKSEGGTEMKFEPFTTAIFDDMGGTALLDAVGYTIDHIEKSKKRLDKVIIAVLTDGEENQSRNFSPEKLEKEILRKEVDSWEFIYMIACNQAITRNICMQFAGKLGFGMIFGVDANEYAHSVEQINKHITSLRKNDTVTNYAAPLAKTGYSREMKIGKFSARLMRAPRLKSDKSESLPPGAPIPVFPVDALPGCPPDWIGGDGSYVCPVDAGWGLWFDFTGNDAMNTAVISSVKGMNPITGQKLDGLTLEKFEGECPVHKEKFKTGRLCEKCGYKWPAQSYVAYPNDMWWDGFRQADGTVRQFFFSEEEARDVASLVIGKENTVPAFGFAFFEPKKARTPMMNVGGVYNMFQGGGVLRSAGVFGCTGISGPTGMQGSIGSSGARGFTGHTGPRGSKGIVGRSMRYGAGGQSVSAYYSQNSAGGGGGSLSCSDMTMHSMVSDDASIQADTEAEEKTMPYLAFRLALAAVSVGAGAEITQELKDDDLGVADWKEKPSQVIRLYFVFKEQFKEILKKGGVKNLAGDKAGYLKKCPVG